MSAGFLQALGLEECCVAHTLQELAAKAVRLARDEDGVRNATWATCRDRAQLHEGRTPPLFEDAAGDAAVGAWWSFLRTAHVRAQA